MLLDAPALALVKTAACCSAVEWGRLRAAHRCLQVDEELLFREIGLAANSLESSPSMGDAARSGLLHVVLARLRLGEDPDQRERKHPRYTPLHRAASGGHRAIARLLLRQGASANARDRLGFCALHFAANQSEGLVRDLLSARCDVAAKNLQGLSPLHSAAGMGRGDICTLLLEAGAPVHAEDPCGTSPACLARRAAERRQGPEREACEALARCLDDKAKGNSQRDDAWRSRAKGQGSPVGPGTWHYLERGEAGSDQAEWIPFDAVSAEIVAAAHARHEPELLIRIRDNTYRIDFDQLTQTNTDSGTVRSISLRTPAASTRVGWVPAAPGHWEGLVSTGAQRLLARIEAR
mmetsp:Transcript_60566/g.121296  ORF Transcript_60566/g.121296 Transcript_60566/m.121296 type:complete len:350 (-) Transcript_60566:135-1184(-)